MDHGPAIAWMKDEQGRHVYVNEVFARRFKVTPDQWLGRTDFEIFPEEWLGSCVNMIEMILAEGFRKSLSKWRRTRMGSP